MLEFPTIRVTRATGVTGEVKARTGSVTVAGDKSYQSVDVETGAERCIDHAVAEEEVKGAQSVGMV